METVAGHSALNRRLRQPAIAIGNFDGAHLGHQQLFAAARRHAALHGGESVVLTFEPHPAKLLNPALAPRLITTRARKLELIAAAGIDTCVVEPFTRALADLSPEEFVAQVVAGALGARTVCVGWDFTFGKRRAGTPDVLAALGQRHGFDVEVVPPVSVDGLVCSSTKIREFVLAGRVDGAAVLLGRDFELEGEVVPGAGRGATIGIPTANLRPETELQPAPGVYAGWAEVLGDEPAFAFARGARWKAAINVGTNPTFVEKGVLSVEAHLVDLPQQPLHGARLRLGFRRRLRGEQRFPSVEALVAQIRADIEATRAA